MTGTQPGPLLRAVPNLITAVRLGLLPVYAWLVLVAREAVAAGLPVDGGRFWAAAVLAFVGFSDVVDGAIARRYHCETALGAVLDPLADKVAQVTGLVLLTFFAEPAFTAVPWFVLLVIVVRDLVLGVGAVVLWHLLGKPFRVTPGRIGRTATFTTFSLLIAATLGLPEAFVTVLAVVSSVLVVLSGLRYVLAGVELNRRRHEGQAASSPEVGG